MSSDEDLIPSSEAIDEACYDRDFDSIRFWSRGHALADFFPEATPLHTWAGSGDVEVVRVLLECGFANVVDRFNDVGYTALHLASMSGHIEVVRLLISASANVNSNDESRIGETPLDFAIQRGHVDVAHVLLDAGANPEIRTWMQLNAIDRVAQKITEMEEGTGPVSILQQLDALPGLMKSKGLPVDDRLVQFSKDNELREIVSRMEGVLRKAPSLNELRFLLYRMKGATSPTP